MSKLYELSVVMNDVYEMVLDEEVDLDALENALQAIEAELEVKVEGGIKLIRSLTAFADAVRAEKAFHEKRLKVIENRLKRIKEYYKQNLELVGKTKVTTAVGTMAVQTNPASLSIVNESLIPAEYLIVVPEHYEIDRDKVKQSLKDGREVPGAVLMKGTHLRLR